MPSDSTDFITRGYILVEWITVSETLR